MVNGWQTGSVPGPVLRDIGALLAAVAQQIADLGPV